MTTVILTADALPNIRRLQAKMKALGAGPHDYFIRSVPIDEATSKDMHWCTCSHCARKRAHP